MGGVLLHVWILVFLPSSFVFFFFFKMFSVFAFSVSLDYYFFSIVVIRFGLFYAFALSCKRYEFMNFDDYFFFICFALNFIYYVSFSLIYLIFRRNLCRFALHFIILQFFLFFFKSLLDITRWILCVFFFQFVFQFFLLLAINSV